MRILLAMFLCSVAFANQPTPDAALKLLMEGNQRFAESQKKGAGRSQERRLAKKTYQNPYAVIVACSDSRVAPEILFDGGIGDFFIVRVAGNVVSDVGIESIAYAVTQLETPLILVMGHQNCGAVKAVLSANNQGIPAIAKLIKPAILEVQKQNVSDPLKIATEINALNAKKSLSSHPIFRKKIGLKQLQIEAAYYDFSTGKVELLKPQ